MSDDVRLVLERALDRHRAGDLDAAEGLYRQVLDTAPRQADALHLLGVVMAQRGRSVEAIALIEAATAEALDDATMHANLGRARKAVGLAGSALAAFDRAFKLGATDPGVHNDRGNVLLELGRPLDAVESQDRAIALRPDYAEAHSNRGNALRALGRNDEALAAYDRAIALRPDFADAHSNRGNVLQDLDRHAEAVASYDQALALRPGHVDAWANRGVALRALGRHQEALASYDQAVALDPERPALRANRSLCLLQTGDFARGWVEHEWRLRMPAFGDRAGRFARPAWRGEEALAGKAILLHAEQGFGDTLQFCRYVAPVAARGGRVLLEVGRPLARLMTMLPDVARVVTPGEALPEFDLHCPLLSLPLAFGTTLESIPYPPRFALDPMEVERWRQRVAALPARRVGLVWEGSSLKRHPEGRAADRRRSVSLGRYAPLGSVPGVSFISLQVGEAARQAATPPMGLAVLDVVAELGDFADTAAAIAVLDLVITVDTAVAHLAGSLGKPVWILLQADSDWRWLVGRQDSPWYPRARLFRQRGFGDWDGVMAEVAAALSDWVAAA